MLGNTEVASSFLEALLSRADCPRGPAGCRCCLTVCFPAQDCKHISGGLQSAQLQRKAHQGVSLWYAAMPALRSAENRSLWTLLRARGRGALCPAPLRVRDSSPFVSHCSLKQESHRTAEQTQGMSSRWTSKEGLTPP